MLLCKTTSQRRSYCGYPQYPVRRSLVQGACQVQSGKESYLASRLLAGGGAFVFASFLGGAIWLLLDSGAELDLPFLVFTLLGPLLGVISSCLLYTSPSPRDRTRSRM